MSRLIYFFKNKNDLDAIKHLRNLNSLCYVILKTQFDKKLCSLRSAIRLQFITTINLLIILTYFILLFLLGINFLTNNFLTVYITQKKLHLNVGLIKLKIKILLPSLSKKYCNKYKK